MDPQQPPTAWTQVEDTCRFPSTHDKLLEAHYFVHQMVEHYHEPDEFRFSLSAFLQASRSVTFFLQSECACDNKLDSWYKQQQQALSADPQLKALNSLRVQTVHMKALAPKSRAGVGWFKHGSMRGSLPLPLDPKTYSIDGLLLGRVHLDSFAEPQRGWIGEELGVDREWVLEGLADDEVVSVCITNLEKLRRLVWEVHGIVTPHSAPYPREGCIHAKSGYTYLRESQVFPEVLRCWAGEDPDRFEAKEDVCFRAGPSESAETLHVMRSGENGSGWIGPPSRLWPSYGSVILRELNGDQLSEKTAGFFRWGTLKPLSRDASEPQ